MPIHKIEVSDMNAFIVATSGSTGSTVKMVQSQRIVPSVNVFIGTEKVRDTIP